MSNCLRCHRSLKEHHESGMGSTCRRKAQNEPATDNKIRVVPLFNSKLPRRSYLVFTTPRATVIVKDTGSERYAECTICEHFCQHIQLVAEIDNAKFPQEKTNIIEFPEPSKVLTTSVMDLVEQDSRSIAEGLKKLEKSKPMQIVDRFDNGIMQFYTVKSGENLYYIKRFFNFLYCSCNHFLYTKTTCKHQALVVNENVAEVAA